MTKKYPPLTIQELVARCNAEGLSITFALVPNQPTKYRKKQSTLSTRAEGVLEMQKINLEQLTEFTFQQVLEFRNCGIHTLKVLKKALTERGLHFKHKPTWEEILEYYRYNRRAKQ